MSSFWPDGLSISNVRSPYEILESAREEWETATEGILTLVFQKSESEDDIETIIVHAKHVPDNRTVTLFSIIHRLNSPYPITIQPKDEKIPNFLKKSYYVSRTTMGDIILGLNPLQETKQTRELITNNWVSDTPSEFREKLTEAFNLSEVKAAVLNLTSSKGTLVDADNEAQK